MQTIRNDVINEVIINKSRFIAILCNINDKEMVKDKINYYKGIYKDATHYCFAYIIDSYMKSSDDGEPSGTAGVPILNVLKNNDLEHILCIVIRYFGGIKLGAGGLIRAYSKSTREVISISDIVSLTNGYYIEMEFDYNDIKLIDGILKNFDVRKVFDEKIIYSFYISSNDFDSIYTLLSQKVKILKKEPMLIGA